MKCSEFESLWIARADGVSTREEDERLRWHSDSCAECGALRRGLESLELELETLDVDTVEAPAFLKTRVLARLDEVRLPRGWGLRALFTSRRLLALSTACLAFFAGLLAREVHRLNRWALDGRAQEVVLEFQSPEARQVNLVGDFNNWGSEGGGVRAEKQDGRWVFRVRLEPGRYNYAFVVDGRNWLPDPRAAGIIPDGFGGMNSVLYVPPRGSGRTDTF